VSNDVFTLVVSFKDPDGCGEFIHWASRAEVERLKLDGMEHDKACDTAYTNPQGVNKKFFTYGEYGVVELKLGRDGTGTCRLVPRNEQ
jgi:hypothetical protein